MPPTLRAHVFADMLGYGHLIERRGEDEALKLMRTYDKIVRQATASRAVDIQKTGDQFHLAFRLPVEAVRCAIDIAEALDRHNRQLASKIPVRFGVDAGQSVRRAGRYVGPAPVLAAHLCHRSQPGQILVSAGVRSLIRTAKIPMRDLGVWKSPAGTTVHVYEARPPDEPEVTGAGAGTRFLTALFFTDIVRSTASAAALGDRRWRDTVEQHNAIVREELDRYGGTEIDTAGDGFYAAFDSPSRALRCALAAGERVRGIAVDIRAGVHIGECEIVAGKIGGIVVTIGARIKDRAGPGEVLVSQGVKDSLLGSGFRFVDRGLSELKGVLGEWQLYAVRPPAQ